VVQAGARGASAAVHASRFVAFDRGRHVRGGRGVVVIVTLHCSEQHVPGMERAHTCTSAGKLITGRAHACLAVIGYCCLWWNNRLVVWLTASLPVVVVFIVATSPHAG
jgi:hypothetical protein